MFHAEDARGAAEVRAFEVKTHRFALGLFRVAERLRLRRVDALAFSACIALAAGEYDPYSV
jgi:hypothetical protein